MAQPRKSFKTAKGTELPLLNLKGKEYLQVMHRIVWFREENPRGSIKTQMLAQGGEGANEFAVFRAEIFIDTEKGPLLVASGHKKETRGGFDDYIEKAESGSVGRALALLGFGTQFAASDLDEGDRLADSPAPVLEAVVGDIVIGSGGNTGTTVLTPKRTSFRKNMSATNGSGSTSSNDDI